MTSLLCLSRLRGFASALVIAFLGPAVIPGMSIDYQYFFIMVLVLGAWFSFKWRSVIGLQAKSSLLEIVLGALLVVADYAQNLYFGSQLGLLDMIVIFSGLALAFYGVKSFRLFWVPAAYGIILLLGYQLENVIPNYVALQDWLAGIMSSSMRIFGVNATVSGEVVYLNGGSALIALDVASSCTGVQGILAFGMLSTMAVLDIKAKVSKLIPLLLIGFVGAFLINIARLLLVFLTFEYLGVELGTLLHVYAGYLLFVVWVLIFWDVAFRLLVPRNIDQGKPV